MPNPHDLSGALTCAKYAFAPNYYHYCGPDTKGEFSDYLKAEISDGGLVEHLVKFETLYPYLVAIAEANGLADPLASKVVEAYWLGNSLLEKVKESELFTTLIEKQNLKKRLPKKELASLLPKINMRARIHHSFHVFNVFTRTGHHTVQHTVNTMDQCLISWGKISEKSKCKLILDSQQLIYQQGKLKFKPHSREVIVPLDKLFTSVKVGDWVSVHWGFVCDKISPTQVKQLEKYTLHHLSLANETI
jgi:hydrogenase maturation factor